MKKRLIIYLFILLPVISSCIYPFEPKGLEESESIITVEGDIICGDTSVFTISRSINLSDNNKSLVTLKADSVYVEDENGEKIAAAVVESRDNNFYEKARYKYVADTKSLNPDLRYRLVVVLPESSVYLSEYVPVLQSPPIDSITYQVTSDRHALRIMVHSVSEVDSLKYFRWDFEEDWEFTARYFAEWRYDERTLSLLEIPFSENRYYCWKKDSSKDILVFNTEKLDKNRVDAFVVKDIDYHDDRISLIYAITVRQKMITKRGYEYWSNIRKNNDQTGGIFSPQPSEMSGNVYSLHNPSEPVIGFISACRPSSLRKFISRDYVTIYKDVSICVEDTLDVKKWQTAYSQGKDVAYIIGKDGKVVWGSGICVDCTRTGTKKRPDFWPVEY